VQAVGNSKLVGIIQYLIKYNLINILQGGFDKLKIHYASLIYTNNKINIKQIFDFRIYLLIPHYYFLFLF